MMTKEPNKEVELGSDGVVELPDGRPSPSSPMESPPSANGPPMAVSSSHPPTRFNSAAPLAPPRPDPVGHPSRGLGLPRPPAVPSAQSNAEKTGPMVELQEQLELTRRTLTTREAEVRMLLGQRDARITELESLRGELAAREFAIKELEFAILAREAKIRDLEKELDAARSPGEGPGDDLKQIRGIGRGFERELKRIGVRTFAQIAAWTPSDIDEIAARIKAQPERIRRDEWVRHAAELADQRAK